MKRDSRLWLAIPLVAACAAFLTLAFAPVPPGPSSSGQFRLLSTNSTASAAALTAGRYTTTTLDAVISGASANIVSLGRVGDATAPRQRGCEVTFVGVGADNATGSYRIWQVKRGRASGTSSQANDMELAYLGAGTFTLSSSVGAASATTVLSTERVADTVTFTQATASTTPKGIGDVLENVFGSPAAAAYSPADNTPGRLWVPEIGNGDLYVELWVGTATSVNAVVDVGS